MKQKNRTATEEKVSIHQTEDYDLFVTTEENRTVRPKHVTVMKASIEAHGFMKECPILVSENEDGLYIVADGQHRLAACRELEVPVWYQVIPAARLDEKIRVINANSRKWTDGDFLHHFCALGKESYLLLRDFMAAHEMGLGSALGMLSGSGKISRPVGIRATFRNGELLFTEDAIDAASLVMEPVNDIRNVHERIAHLKRDEAFIKALLILCCSKAYDHDRMMAALELNLSHVVYCTRVTDYLNILGEIYNYRRQEGNRMGLSKKGLVPLYSVKEEEAPPAKATVLRKAATM